MTCRLNYGEYLWHGTGPNKAQELYPPQRPLIIFSGAGKRGEVKSKRAEPGEKGNESAGGTLASSPRQDLNVIMEPLGRREAQERDPGSIPGPGVVRGLSLLLIPEIST